MSNDLIENPGRRLQALLQEIYPFDNSGSKSFVTEIDYAIVAEGEFARLLYQSSINYLIRRLITSAEYLKRKYASYPEGRDIEEIRAFLRDFTRIPNSQSEKIFTVLMECLKSRKRKIPQKQKDDIRREARIRGEKCYICGCEIDFERANESQFNAFTLDHIWPRKMGGKSSLDNLKVACKRCNENKADNIDASDFHYEEICLVTDKVDKNFNTEFKKGYKIAVSAKSEFKCVVCGQPVERVGELYFARREPSDNWHFLNIDAYCSEHTPE